MPVDATQIETLIRAAFPDADVKVDDLRGDGNYLSAHVISASFEGLSRIQQHRKVYAALGNTMDTTLHALALHTSVPQDKR
jgi:stress-induced morphogen